jgi:tetrahydromethanopterin S-methyltransferase subunit C
MEQKIDRAIAGLVSLFGAMMLTFVGLIIMLMAAAQGLARTMPDWAASLIIGVVALMIGMIMVVTARKALSPSGMIPDRTIRNLGADAQSMKEHAL